MLPRLRENTKHHCQIGICFEKKLPDCVMIDYIKKKLRVSIAHRQCFGAVAYGTIDNSDLPELGIAKDQESGHL
jgi:hypothetical protein